MTNPLDLDHDFDPDARQLCADGSCTGLLGEDGLCKICGGLNVPGSLHAQPTEAPHTVTDDDFDDRRLCSDGNCTGLLGEDGRCKLCGKSS